MHKRIREVAALEIERLQENDDEISRKAVIKHVLGQFIPKDLFKEWKGSPEVPAFARFAGDRAVGRIIQDIMRRTLEPGDGEDDEQLHFEEFPRVRLHYPVERDDDEVYVPVLKFTEPEARAKLAEMDATIEGQQEHRDQLELFWTEHGIL